MNKMRELGKHPRYLRDLPLHHTQKELQCDEQQDFADFELNLRPTTDFKGQLLSRGAWLKVLEPQWLADEIYHMHRQAVMMYEANSK